MISALNRRHFLKYTGVTAAAVIGASALGLDYLRSPQPRIPNTTTSTTSSSMSSYTSSSYASSSTSVVQSTSSTLSLSTLSDLDDPKSGYPELANELRKLPEFQQDTQESRLAVQRIATLALQSDDTQVKEAFKIMLQGGTPSPFDFSYVVPNWNTELQVLFWLAETNEFKKNDTLALAIAMVNGLWVTMGDEQVAGAVRGDTNSMLRFGRETSEWQRTNGLTYNLENYPLEAKVCWAWTGHQSTIYSQNHAIAFFKDKKFDLKSYEWDTVDTEKLSQVRAVTKSNNWINADVNEFSKNTEKYFYFAGGPGQFSRNWIYTLGTPYEGTVTVEEETVKNSFIGNATFLFDYYVKNGKGYGVCGDEVTLLRAYPKTVSR